MTNMVKLPPEFISTNDIPVSVATIKRGRMEEILREAVEDDRQHRGEPSVGQIMEAVESYGDACSQSNITVSEQEMRLHGIRALLAHYGNHHVEQSSVPDGFRLVNEDELIELSDSILGNYYRGQDWDRERITNMLEDVPKFGEEE